MNQKIILLAIAALTVFGLSMTGGAASVASENVTISDPANDTVEVDLDYSSATDATVELVASDGTIVSSSTISGAAGATETFTLSTFSAGEYTVNVDSIDAANVSQNETRVIAKRTVTVDDAANETVYLDVMFEGDQSAISEIVLEDETGSSIYSASTNYDPATESTSSTVKITDTDGLVSGNLTMVSTVSPASGYSNAYASNTDQTTTATSGILDQEVFGQNPLLIGAAIVLLLFFADKVGDEYDF